MADLEELEDLDALDIEEMDADDDESSQLYEHYRIVADAKQGLMRVDKFLIDHLANISRNRIQKAADAGFIMCNERPIKRSYRVKPFDVIQVMLDRPLYSNTIKPEEIPLEIVYEDSDLMVVNKAAGMVVHPGHGNWHATLLHALAWHLKDKPQYDINNPEIGLVHRIDKDTSGLLVIAKTPEAKTSLGLQFFNKTTKREYNALVWGNFTEDEGRIEGNIARNPRDRMQMIMMVSVPSILTATMRSTISGPRTALMRTQSMIRTSTVTEPPYNRLYADSMFILFLQFRKQINENGILNALRELLVKRMHDIGSVAV